MSDFLIACGGTGGHLSPGIALAQRLRARGHEVRLLISEKRIDRQLSAKYPDFRFDSIPGAPLAYSPAGFVRFLSTQLKGLLFSFRLLRESRPKVVVGFGGFTTAAIILAAWVSRIPVALHEANRVPGRAVRFMARFARRVYLPIEVELFNGYNPAKVRHAGLPVREEIKRDARHECAESFGLDVDRPTLALLGGSQGAQALNTWAAGAAGELARHGIQMLVVTGPGKGTGDTRSHPDAQGKPVKLVTLPFCDRMGDLLSASDLVVSRSGAGTIAELVQCRVPAVLVPYPHAADDHQAANAAYFMRCGGGVVVKENRLANLTATVLSLLTNDDALTTCRTCLGEMSRSDALSLMLDDLENITRASRERPEQPSTLLPA